MKNTAIKMLAATFVLALIILSGCKKAEAGPKGDTGAQGPQGPVLNMTSGGYVTGTITGTRKDGVAFNEPFSYTYYFPGMGGSGTLDSLGSSNYNFNVQRQVADIFSSSYCNFDITTTSKTASIGTLDINFSFEKALSSSKYFSFYGFNSVTTATGLSYNASTGLFSGVFNVTISGGNNSTGNSATLVGSFQANTTQRVQLTHQDGAIKAD